MIGGSRLQFGLQSLFVPGIGMDETVTDDMLVGHTVPLKLAFEASSILPAATTLKVYKGKTLVATMPLRSGGSVDLAAIEDLPARQFSWNDRYGLVMTIQWAGREYAFLELMQGPQDVFKPQGASLPY